MAGFFEFHGHKVTIVRRKGMPTCGGSAYEIKCICCTKPYLIQIVTSTPTDFVPEFRERLLMKPGRPTFWENFRGFRSREREYWKTDYPKI